MPRCAARFRDAGHILGSAIVEVEAGGRARSCSRATSASRATRSCATRRRSRRPTCCWSNRPTATALHKSLTQTLDEFAFALNDTLASKRGNVVIPAFAVGRTQDILYFIAELRRQKRVPAFDVYVDSPMAVAATRITLAPPRAAGPRVAQACGAGSKAAPGGRVHFTEDVEDSKRINSIRSGAVIISASGMCDGGRIKHHLKYNISRPRVRDRVRRLPGRGLARAAHRRRREARQPVPRAATRCGPSCSPSAGCRRTPTATRCWAGWANFRAAPQQCWVVHGEPLAAHSLRDAIERRYGWRAAVPAPRQTVEL